MAFALAGLLVLSLGAILAVLYQLVLGGGGTAANPTTLAGPNIPANARRLGSLAELERSGVPNVPFVVTVTEAELNQRIQSELTRQGSQLPFRDVRAKVLDDRIDFSGQTTAVGVDVPATVGMRFFARGGGIGYEVQSISFGPLPVPGPARQALTDQIDRQLAGQSLSDQWVLDEIHARVGIVTLVGRPR